MFFYHFDQKQFFHQIWVTWRKLFSHFPAPSVIFRYILKLFVVAVVVSVLLVLILRWLPPPSSAFMVTKWVDNYLFAEKPVEIRYNWVSLESISVQVPLAVIAAEDQKFPDHYGFDFESLKSVFGEKRKSGRIRGASTISQQVAKNLFLWNGRSYFRKGMEAWFTILIELFWPKHRILEVYVNIAQFGPGIYGAGAACEYYWRQSPERINRWQAAMLAAVLPNPIRFKINAPSNYVLKRVNWILGQMKQLGGKEYLKKIY